MKTLFVRKLSQEFFAKTPFFKITKYEIFLKKNPTISKLGHILIHGVESWSGVEPWSGVVFLELVFWSQCKSFKVRDD